MLKIRKQLGLISIVIGLILLVTQSDITTASIYPHLNQIPTSPNTQINLRYTFTPELPVPSTYNIVLTRGNTFITNREITLSPKTIFSGILSFKSPSEKGSYDYIIKVYPTNENAVIKVVVE